MVSKKRKPYVTAGLLTIAVFIMGFLLGLSVVNLQLEEIRMEMDRNELDTRNLQMELAFLETLDEETFCSYMEERVIEIDQEAGRMGNMLVETSGFEDRYFEMLRRRYSVLLIQDWFFSNRLNERCGANRVNVLYFFEKECPPCINQGYVLDYLVSSDKTRQIRISSIDRNLDEPIINILVKSFGVEEAPTIIVNGEKIKGFRNREQLTRIFCSINSELSFCV